MSPSISDLIGSETPPIIYVLATNGIGHAIIIIQVGITIYCVGLAYKDDIGMDHMAISKKMRVGKDASVDVGHYLPRKDLQLLLMSPDLLYPTDEQSSKIISVGFLTRDMVTRMNDYFRMCTGISIQCGDVCPFVDLIQYDPTDPIFNNTDVYENIHYIPYEYTIKDLEETYNDRASDLDKYLDHMGSDIRASQITSGNAEQMTDKFRELIVMQFTKEYNQDKAAVDEMLTDEDYTITKEEHKEEMEQLYNRFIKKLSFKIRNVGKITEKFKKLTRTKERRNMLTETASMSAQDHRGGCKPRKKTRRR